MWHLSEDWDGILPSFFNHCEKISRLHSFQVMNIRRVRKICTTFLRKWRRWHWEVDGEMRVILFKGKRFARGIIRNKRAFSTPVIIASTIVKTNQWTFAQRNATHIQDCASIICVGNSKDASVGKCISQHTHVGEITTMPAWNAQRMVYAWYPSKYT